MAAVKILLMLQTDLLCLFYLLTTATESTLFRFQADSPAKEDVQKLLSIRTILFKRIKYFLLTKSLLQHLSFLFSVRWCLNYHRTITRSIFKFILLLTLTCCWKCIKYCLNWQVEVEVLTQVLTFCSVCFSTMPRWTTTGLGSPPVLLTAPSRSLTSETEGRSLWQTSEGKK